MPKILVADDNANIQKMVTLSFEERGIQVVAVGNGEAAVRRIPDVQPDLVLADIFMPVRNGYEVCEFVKKDERFSHVPVILLVGAFDPLDEKEARRVGADGVLKKPFVPPDPLIAMVMSALEKNPKIAAELAKAKEAKEAPAPVAVESIPEPPTSVRAEPKPLPDFPEPATDEEAAIAYGISSPRPATDDGQIEASGEAKGPVAQPGRARDEEEFDGSSTSHDWRRNAMDFDVPAEAANRAAFMHDEDSDAAMFPSERDVPPRHVRVPDPVEESDPLIQDRTAVKAEPEASAPAPVHGSESDFFAPSDSPATAKAEPMQEVEPVVESETVHEPASQASPSHWMDQLAQGSSDRPATDWMSALSEQSAQASIVARPEPAQAESIAPRETPAEDFGAQASSYSSTEVESSHDSAPVHEESSGESFFADEPAPSASISSWLSSAPSAPEPFGETVEATSSEPVPLTASVSDQGFERDTDDSAPLAFKDPDLVEPPAVHVTPEPLLVEDEPDAPSQYGARSHEVQPLHSFLVSPSAPPAEESSASASSGRAEIAVAPLEPEPSITSERIPTGPPPNREALAEIPFLTPPPEFRSQAPEPPAPNSGTVDAVVRKVLEKLEPQLHDLLSQGVLKPLVENLLQSELAKKEK